ncbi:MAG: hypothetical protein KBD16_02960 [Candidatus Pacebacteria bacterium]|nr:hypothetical protein [Candidatus Paceibacterota bacterium]
MSEENKEHTLAGEYKSQDNQSLAIHFQRSDINMAGIEKIGNLVEGMLLPKNQEINEMLVCEFRPNHELWLHIDYAKHRKISEKLHLLRDGFKKLAERLASDPLYQKVELLTGTSWIIAKNPKLLERLGFTIAEDVRLFENHVKEYKSKSRRDGISHEHRDDEPGHARISKEDFIRLYNI